VGAVDGREGPRTESVGEIHLRPEDPRENKEDTNAGADEGENAIESEGRRDEKRHPAVHGKEGASADERARREGEADAERRISLAEGAAPRAERTYPLTAERPREALSPPEMPGGGRHEVLEFRTRSASW